LGSIPYTSVEGAVEALKEAGFRNTDISVLFPENVGSRDFAHEKGTKAPEGAGGVLGWLVGIGTLAIPGLGPFIAAGPHRGRPGGSRSRRSALAGLPGALIGMGIQEYEAKRYEGRVRNGGILLLVHSDASEWTKRAKEILERTGAQDIASAGEASADYAKSDEPLSRKASWGGDNF
jgi:hypothetical protein